MAGESWKSPEGSLTFEAQGPVAFITINRPRQRNAMNQAMWQTLGEWVEQLPDEIRVLVLRGHNRIFTAGSDIHELAGVSADRINRAFRVMDTSIQAIERSKVVTIASIDGTALGAGFILALACDLRVGTPAVQFGMPVGRLGIMLQSPFLERMIQVVGLSRVKDLVFTARTYDAHEAKVAGILHYLVPAEALEDETFSLAQRVLEQSAPSLTAVKENGKHVLTDSTAGSSSADWVGPHFAEGVRAFVEKREPSFVERISITDTAPCR